MSKKVMREILSSSNPSNLLLAHLNSAAVSFGANTHKKANDTPNMSSNAMISQKKKEEELIREARIRNISRTYEFDQKAMRQRHDEEHAALERKQQIELERLKHDRDVRINAVIRDSQNTITRIFESIEDSSASSHQPQPKYSVGKKPEPQKNYSQQGRRSVTQSSPRSSGRSEDSVDEIFHFVDTLQSYNADPNRNKNMQSSHKPVVVKEQQQQTRVPFSVMLNNAKNKEVKTQPNYERSMNSSSYNNDKYSRFDSQYNTIDLPNKQSRSMSVNVSWNKENSYNSASKSKTIEWPKKQNENAAHPKSSFDQSQLQLLLQKQQKQQEQSKYQRSNTVEISQKKKQQKQLQIGLLENTKIQSMASIWEKLQQNSVKNTRPSSTSLCESQSTASRGCQYDYVKRNSFVGPSCDRSSSLGSASSAEYYAQTLKRFRNESGNRVDTFPSSTHSNKTFHEWSLD